MNSFLAHVGDGNAIDLDESLAQRRSFRELIIKLPAGPERDYFETDDELQDAFPTGTFNVWGVPEGAISQFDKTSPGDILFFAPSVGPDGLIQYFGVVRVIPRQGFPKASRILWTTPREQAFPYLIFFDAEKGLIPWFNFTTESGYSPDWNPRGWYVRLARPSFLGTRSGVLYLSHLRKHYRFVPVR